MAMTNDTLRDDLIKQFNAQYKESPMEIMSESDLAKVPGWITTGNYALNWIISKNMFKGLPMGRVTLLTGDAGSGKSMIALSMMREPSIDLIVYFDSEGGGISNDFAQFLGIDSSKILYQPMNTMEELKIKMGLVIDIIEKNKSKKNVLMIIDSISMLTTERELDEKGGCYTPDTQISILKDGTIIVKTISEVIEGDLVRTHLGDWQPIEKVWKFSKEEKPELIEIETDDGDIVKLTPQHRLLVNRDNEIQWVMAGDLKLSDELQKLKI